MGLAAACVSNGIGCQFGWATRAVVVDLGRCGVGQEPVVEIGEVRARIARAFGLEDVGMRRNFSNRKCVCFLPRPLPQKGASAHVDGYARPKVGKCEVGLPIASKCRPQQREQCLVLVDGKQLTIALRPSPRGKVEAHDFYF